MALSQRWTPEFFRRPFSDAVPAAEITRPFTRSDWRYEAWEIRVERNVDFHYPARKKRGS
jgi:hypothetical protein